MIGLIYFLLIGLAAGWLAGKVMEGRSFGLARTSSLASSEPSWAGSCFKSSDLRPPGCLEV